MTERRYRAGPGRLRDTIIQTNTEDFISYRTTQLQIFTQPRNRWIRDPKRKRRFIVQLTALHYRGSHETHSVLFMSFVISLKVIAFFTFKIELQSNTAKLRLLEPTIKKIQNKFIKMTGPIRRRCRYYIIIYNNI